MKKNTNKIRIPCKERQNYPVRHNKETDRYGLTRLAITIIMQYNQKLLKQQD